MKEVDDEFYDRADAHIHLANGHVTDDIGQGQASASLLYAAARFNAWVSACGFVDSEEMFKAKEELIEYFSTEYRNMLEENLDDYISNFKSYMKS